jgi:hypothetical protein
MKFYPPSPKQNWDYSPSPKIDPMQMYYVVYTLKGKGWSSNLFYCPVVAPDQVGQCNASESEHI